MLVVDANTEPRCPFLDGRPALMIREVDGEGAFGGLSFKPFVNPPLQGRIEFEAVPENVPPGAPTRFAVIWDFQSQPPMVGDSGLQVFSGGQDTALKKQINSRVFPDDSKRPQWPGSGFWLKWKSAKSSGTRPMPFSTSFGLVAKKSLKSPVPTSRSEDKMR